MLVFVIPLKSTQVSKSWEYVSKLFERCIRSVCNQTSTNFSVIVVCHEKPQIEFNHPHITYVKVDFSAPSSDCESKRRDKRRKMFVGLNYARQLEPSHTMHVDADDCVSKYLAEFVEQNPQSNGWFVNKGYVYQDGNKFIYFKRKDFHQWCGTSNIIRYGLHNVPESLSYDCKDFYRYYVAHRKVVKNQESKGTPIEPLPFAGATYILGHSENLSSNSFNNLIGGGKISVAKNILHFRPLTGLVRNDFGIYNVV